jgi:hypothetical protein
VAVVILPSPAPTHNRVQSLIQLLAKGGDDQVMVGASFNLSRDVVHHQPKVKELYLEFYKHHFGRRVAHEVTSGQGQM